jgi:hypothetical protein
MIKLHRSRPDARDKEYLYVSQKLDVLLALYLRLNRKNWKRYETILPLIVSDNNTMGRQVDVGNIEEANQKMLFVIDMVGYKN